MRMLGIGGRQGGPRGKMRTTAPKPSHQKVPGLPQ